MSKWVVECVCGTKAVLDREPRSHVWFCKDACEQMYIARIREAGQQVLVGFEG